jgi:phytoene/squalene synthetase
MAELFPASLQPHLRAFGRFVRLCEELRDDVLLGRIEKLSRLTALEATLDGADVRLWASKPRAIVVALRESLRQTGITREYPRQLLHAARRDAEGSICDTWQDLMEYCRLAAVPIGRYMLALAGEDEDVCGPSADALCTALCILKRLRDCSEPAVRFNRLRIPRRFLDDAMITPEHLRAASAKGQTRAVLDRVLDGVDGLLQDAAPLPVLIRRRGLVMHTAIVLCRARKLADRFRRQDPLQQRVGLAGWQRRLCHWTGTLRALGRS